MTLPGDRGTLPAAPPLGLPTGGPVAAANGVPRWWPRRVWQREHSAAPRLSLAARVRRCFTGGSVKPCHRGFSPGLAVAPPARRLPRRQRSVPPAQGTATGPAPSRGAWGPIPAPIPARGTPAPIQRLFPQSGGAGLSPSSISALPAGSRLL